MEDISKLKFNYLTAIKPLFKCNRSRTWIWECQCDCGNKTKVRITKLKSGTTKSCGCFKAKNLDRTGKEHNGWKGHGDIGLSLFNRMRNNARDRDVEFTVSIEYLWNLFLKQKGICPYSGENIVIPVSLRLFKDDAKIASLDRIDSSIGYIEGNLQWVAKRVNYLKHTMTEEYFLDWIKKIYEYKIKK